MRIAATMMILAGIVTAHATDRYVSLSGGHVPPFTSWADAATNIQAAVDAAVASDTVWVTNGLYNTGGKVMAGDLTNRVALDKAVTLRSVNGPAVTIIEGAWDPVTTNGPLAVRSAWLTNGAALVGLTLRNGATRDSGDAATLRFAGGVWCASTTAFMINCVIQSNAAMAAGGGVFSGTLSNCIVSWNRSQVIGGGSHFSQLYHSELSHNVTGSQGGGASASLLSSCRVLSNAVTSAQGVGGGSSGGTNLNSGFVGNSAGIGGGISGGATTNCTIAFNTAANQAGGANTVTLRNCIVVSNSAPTAPDFSSPIAPSFSCFSTVVAGTSNIVADPRLKPDGYHVYPGSPCRGLGNPAFLIRTDIDGQTWALPPSMGCDEPYGNGESILYVDLFSVSPAPPYLSWETASTNIQSAVDAAPPGALILVSSGVYATGGKAAAGDLTNRIMLEKNVTVQSVSGPEVTIIEGAWHPGTTNGATAVRAAWVGDYSTLSGFTLRGGATRSVGDATNLLSGGGAWCASVNAVITNCIIRSNTAFLRGGGVYAGSLTDSVLLSNVSSNGGGAFLSVLTRCALQENQARRGGGAYSSTLTNCLVADNTAPDMGGGVFDTLAVNCLITRNQSAQAGGVMSGTLHHCTVVSNAAMGSPGGVRGGRIYNSIIWANTADNASKLVCEHTCTTPLQPGVGNIDADPQLLPDGVHLALTSPCRGAGSPAYASGVDMDGQPWAIPPSMGCDEVWQATMTASLAGSGAPVLEMDSHAGVSYTVDFATNLIPPVTWHPLQTLVATGAVVTIEDAAATNEMRFYRARVP